MATRDPDARAQSPLPEGRTAWLAEHVLPHEPALRGWLRERLALAPADVDDVVQESYARLAGMGAVDHVAEPRAYLFTVARSLVQQQLRRRQVVAIETMAELDGLGAEAPQASPERVASAREQLALAQRLLAAMPARCRQVFRLRRIEGLSQREVSERLRISQSTVEKHMIRALRLMMDGISAAPAGDGQVPGAGVDHIGREERAHGQG
ncbi:RNA polymerase sigma factor [Luteimonas wenzhouensis]|uniref:RNA polymerase sigma factor n=1 Tax=Luteimonas wenzhouensis TaxID=2599615 RepID=A0A5C5TUQ8_9GAMM|nr:RNA polymerase sigma factor [Luteimonas wenzhouensis]TWT17951.1 RNA polymerase sigma factor [Luteimonas wenzhouensis]